MDDRTFALYVIAALIVLTVLHRRTLLSITAIGIFFISHVVLLLVGLLATPWLADTYLAISYPYLHVEYISSADIIKAITIVVGGMLLAIAAYRCAEMIDTGHWRGRRELGLLAPRYPIIGVGIRPAVLMALLGLSLVIVAAVLAAELPAIKAAISGGLQGEAYYDARYALEAHGRLFAYPALNVLPFLAACIAGTSWYKQRNLLMGYAAVCLTTVVSVLTFKKTYLLNEALVLLATWYVVKMDRTQWRAIATPRCVVLRGVIRKTPKGPLIAILLGFFTFAAGSYYVVAGGSMSLPLAIGFAFERVFSRLTMMALMYAHYYPAVEAHYGLSNVGMLAALTGNRLYEDTVVTLRYFERVTTTEGSGACGTLMDFYGAFGWTGWALLSAALGVSLYLTDRFLTRMPPLLINRVFQIFVLLTVTYIAQASIFRTLSTYGGGIVLALWVLLANRKKLRLAGPGRGAHPYGEIDLNSQHGKNACNI